MIKKLVALFFAGIALVEGAILEVYLITMSFYLFPKFIQLNDGMLQWLSSPSVSNIVSMGPALAFTAGLATIICVFGKWIGVCQEIYKTLSVVNQPKKQNMPVKTPNEA